MEWVPSWSCLQAVSKPVWHIPLLCVQWKTPDDGQRNFSKHVEFHSKNKFEKLVHLVGFIIRNLTRCMVTWTPNTEYNFCFYLLQSSEHNTPTYLNIYSEWEPSSEINLDSVAQNCLTIQLDFIPYQLYHTEMYTSADNFNKEVMSQLEMCVLPWYPANFKGFTLSFHFYCHNF